jgi:serine/threonine-protein kinase SRK2
MVKVDVKSQTRQILGMDRVSDQSKGSLYGILTSFLFQIHQRITIREIRSHPWFLKNLPRELTEAGQAMYYKKDNNAPTYSVQSVEEIMKIVEQARTPPPSSTPVAGFGWAEEEELDSKKAEKQEEEENAEDEYEKQVNEVRASGEFQIS